MLNKIFSGVFDSPTQSIISVSNFLLCMGVSVVIGLFLVWVYTYKSRYTRSFVTTLALIPAVVCVVIMLVNGNVGAGVAVAGAFSLVRFRSVPGTAKEIGTIFLAMGAGLAAGMGYLGYAILFSVVLGTINMIYVHVGLGCNKNGTIDRTLRITIPEDLDYTDIFDDLFSQYTKDCELINVKTTNMGSLFKLTYNLTLNTPMIEKELIDSLRCRNGNLEISMSRQETAAGEL